VEWQGARPPGSMTVMAQADQGDNPAAQKIAEGLYQFTVLDSVDYTIAAWEDLDPQRGVAACVLPGRITTPAVRIVGAKPRTGADEITLAFFHLECAKP
jgi:hypothetical protein